MFRLILAAIIAYALVPQEVIQQMRAGKKNVSFIVEEDNLAQDFTSFCIQNPETCENGKKLVTTIGKKTLQLGQSIATQTSETPASVNESTK